MIFKVRPEIWSPEDAVEVEAENADEAFRKWPDALYAMIAADATPEVMNDPIAIEHIAIRKNRLRQLPCVIERIR